MKEERTMGGKKVLITGASGFIGGHLIRRNLLEGNIVRVLVLPDDPERNKLSGLDIEIMEGNICQLDSVINACQGMDIVFHCAAVVSDFAPQELFDKVNIEGMENMLKAATKARVSRFVEISTNDVFGVKEDVIIDESFPLEKWGEPYPDTKIEAEKLAWRYHKEQGLPVTMVYPCWVYGEGDRTFVPLTADAIRTGGMIYWRDQTYVWPTYVENLVDLLMIISEHPNAVGNGFLVHDGEMDTFQNFCTKIATEIGAKAPTMRIPYGMAKALAKSMEFIWRLLKKKTRPLLTTYTVTNLGSKLQFSIEKAKLKVGWVPKVSYEEGFRRTMEWLKSIPPEEWKTK